MSESTTRWYLLYYNAQRDTHPIRLLRQVKDETGKILSEEALARTGEWVPDEEFRLQWIGRNDKDLVELTPGEFALWRQWFADRWAERDGRSGRES